MAYLSDADSYEGTSARENFKIRSVMSDLSKGF